MTPTSSRGLRSTDPEGLPRTGHDARQSAEPVPAPARGTPRRRRRRRETPEKYTERRRAAIEKLVAEAPPLTPKQILTLQRIFSAPRLRTQRQTA